ncbi:MAG: hypothetical protein ABIA59_07950 [Candidatus Latescibacterota bacterium]
MPESKSSKFRWKLFIAGLAVVTAGYIVLATNEITIAPLLLVLGYCVLIPLSFL